MKNAQKGFIVPLLIAFIALALGGGIFVYIKNKEVPKTSTAENALNQNSAPVPVATVDTPTQVAENGGMETYKNLKKGYEISYPSDAKIDTSDLSCVRIITKEFGSMYVNAGSGDPCGVPTGIGSGMVRLNEDIIVNNKQYSASGFREADNSYGFLGFGFTIGDKIFVTYGVDHSDKSNPNSWKSLGPLTSLDFGNALNSVRNIVSSLKQPTTVGASPATNAAPSQVNTATQIADCIDFSKFSQVVVGNIDKPDVLMDTPVDTMGAWMNTGYIPDNAFRYGNFFWKRALNEPFVAYPIRKSLAAIYKHSNNPSEYEASAARARQSIKNNSNSLTQVINKEALFLGLAPDQLNTIPFKTFDLPGNTAIGEPAMKEGKLFQTFAFKKGANRYLAVLDGGKTVSGVVITCGGVSEQYDRVYNWLKIKSDPKQVSFMSDYDNDYVSITKASKDKKIYEIFSSQKHSSFFEAYDVSNGSITKLSDDGTKPNANCAPLENLMMGGEWICNLVPGPSVTQYYFAH